MVEELLAVWLLPKSGTRRRYFDAGDGLWCEGTTRAREVNVRSGGMDRPRYMKNTFVSQLKTVKNRLSIYEMTSCNSDPSLRTTLCVSIVIAYHWVYSCRLYRPTACYTECTGLSLRWLATVDGPWSSHSLSVAPYHWPNISPHGCVCTFKFWKKVIVPCP